MPIKFLSSHSIAQFTDNLLSKGLSRETVNLVLMVLEMALSYAKEQNNVSVPEIHFLKTAKTQMRVFSQKEQQILVQHLLTKNDIFSFGILFALFTGIRIGEICALDWQDITENTIHISKTMQRLKNSKGVTEVMIFPKTESSDRIIPIPSALKPIIEQYRKFCGFVLVQGNGKFTYRA